jgi:hypothetical protein
MTTVPVNGWQSISAAANLDSTRRPRITQAMLAEYEQLKRQEEQRRQLRDELMSLLTAGAAIEPGPLWAAIREQERRSLTFTKLCALGGQQWAEDIRSRIESIRCRSLVIRTVARGARRRSSQAASNRIPRP